MLNQNFSTMKNFVVIVLLMSLTNIFSQDLCNGIVLNIKDKMTGKSYLKLKEAITVVNDDQSQGFVLTPYSFKKNRYTLSFTLVKVLYCTDEKDYVQILFTDGTKLEIHNGSSYNCDSEFTIYIGGVFGNKKLIEPLSTKKIEAMRFVSVTGVGHFEIDDEKATLIMNNLRCLFDSKL
jgi:hypothetical protein